MSDKRDIKIKMVKIYDNKCMLTGKKLTLCRLTYHHNIVKNCDDKRQRHLTIENGALLSEFIHCYFLHCVIEKHSKELYSLIREILKDYKQAIVENDIEFIEMYEYFIFPTFAVFEDNQKETKRRFRKI